MSIDFSKFNNSRIGASSANQSKNATYQVGKGDNLSTIAKKLGVSLSKLMEANPQIEDASKIYVGQKITIPADKSTSTSTSEQSSIFMGGRRTSAEQELGNFFRGKKEGAVDGLNGHITNDPQDMHPDKDRMGYLFGSFGKE